MTCKKEKLFNRKELQAFGEFCRDEVLEENNILKMKLKKILDNQERIKRQIKALSVLAGLSKW